MAQTSLLQEIEDYLVKTGWSAYHFGRLAVKNGRLVHRLREGRPLLTTTEARVRAFMTANPNARTVRTSNVNQLSATHS
jgi:hypothetical protein